MSDLHKYYEHLDINRPFEYAEGMIDRFTGQVPLVRKDESLLEIVVVDAGLFKSFDPLSPYQAPFVEIHIEGPEGRQLIETSTCHPSSEDPTDEEEEEASFRPSWNERFIFRAAGAVFFRFDLCIEHTVRNRTICGHCAFTAEDLWSRAKDGRQLLTVPLVHNKGGGWEIEEELVGALRLVVGLMTLDTVEKLPKLDKQAHKLSPEHFHQWGYKGKIPKKPKEKEEEKVEYQMPTIEYVRHHLPPVSYTASQPQTQYYSPSQMQSMTMMPSQAPMQMQSPVPMQSMTQMPSPVPTPTQSMTMSRSPLPQPYSVPSPAPNPVMSVPNLVPTSLAPIANNTQSGNLMAPE